MKYKKLPNVSLTFIDLYSTFWQKEYNSYFLVERISFKDIEEEKLYYCIGNASYLVLSMGEYHLFSMEYDELNKMDRIDIELQKLFESTGSYITALKMLII